MAKRSLVSICALAALVLPTVAHAGEICGNGVDDDSDGLQDEGCYSGLSTVCESPLSCNETGFVSPLLGTLHYKLPPDVAPKVPYGLGIGFRRFYSSQLAPGITAPPTFQAAGTAQNGTGAISPAWPTHQANDVALLIVETAGGQAASLSNAQGFTSLSGSPQGDSVNINGTVLTVWWKRAATAAEAAPTVADSGDHQIAQILTFRNVATSGNPWDVTAGSATAGTGTTAISIPGASTTVPNALVVAIVATSEATSASGWTNAALAGLTERTDVSTTSGNDGGFAVATGVKLVAGSYGATTGTLALTARQAALSIALRPVDNAPAWKKPLGERWGHTYTTWIDKAGSGTSAVLTVHTSQGADVRAPWGSTVSGWDRFTPQSGYHVQYIQQRQTSPFEYQIRLLTGETLVYNSSGRLIELWDTLATPNKVLVGYDGNGQVSTVTDASTKRRLLFGYTGTLLTSVAFQVDTTGSFTTYHTTSYGYTSNALTGVTIGGAAAQTNVYTNGYLTQIQDAAGNNILGVAYNETAGKVARLEVPSGWLGYDYDSSRASCTGKTVLYFNLGNTSTCSVDGDCGSGFLCGGKTGTGATGKCFRAARCLTVSSPSEDVITQVTSLGPPSETCTGACLQASQYIWNTGSGALDLQAIQDPAGNYTAQAFNSNGLPTTIVYGDNDTDPTNSGGSRKQFIAYDTAFPGKVKETWRQSDLVSSPACVAGTSGGSGCARTVRTYNADGKLTQIQELGSTYNADNAVTSYTYTTTMTYDDKGRLTQINGPLATADDVTDFGYYDSSSALKSHFLYRIDRKKNSSAYLTQFATEYDFWGNPTELKDADNTITCLTFDAARGYLTQRREAMAGQTTCTAGTGDLVTKWLRDSALRLVRIDRPDGTCLFFEYDSKGRLLRTKRRDDCNPSSAGDKQEYVYDTEGLVTEIQTYDASSTLVAKQPFTYYDSRQLEKVINPVNTSTWTGITYDPRGLVSQVDAAGGLGKTVFNRTGTAGAEGRVTSVDRYKTSTLFDSWSLIYAWLGEQTSVTDGDSKVTQMIRDDLGRVINVVSPDKPNREKRMYDEASRLTKIIENYSSTTGFVHNFTFDHLGRKLVDDYAAGNATYGSCNGTTSPPSPEIERVYDAPPGGCPSAMTSSGGCQHTAGRLAYTRVRLYCGAGTDNSMDRETFYSYDAAGRVITEYIVDEAGPRTTALQRFQWTPNGELAQVITPSTTTLAWTYGSGISNSDGDRVTALARAGSTFIDAVAWYPYGPLQQYNQQNTLGGIAMRTRITRNLAYRPTGVYMEAQSGGGMAYSVVLAEDAKGRITKRDYTSSAGGVQDSYFLYDDQDRVLCETTSLVSSCPTSGSSIKNSHTASPPFTNAGDWKVLKRPIPGSTGGLTHTFNPSGYGTSHRITSVSQSDGTPALGTTTFDYAHPYSTGSRSQEYLGNGSLPDYRAFQYDVRHNLKEVAGFRKNGASWTTYYNYSGFDDQNRRAWKSMTTTVGSSTVVSTWLYYYDPIDRLTEILYIPNTQSPGTNTVFQLLWLDDSAGWLPSDRYRRKHLKGKRCANQWQSLRPVRLTATAVRLAGP
ncbi:MAG: hypothetical protein SFX73_31555 [Kofleriaceae bacterium]|nr:hypothetical protein [Kofleriaceae bacterium]